MYDAFETPRAVRGDLAAARPRPGARLPAERPRARARRRCERGPATAELVELVLRHEHQHGETMLQAIELAGCCPRPRCRARRPGPAAPARPHRPARRVDDPRRAVHRSAPARVGFAYDNERPRHRTDARRLPHRPHAGHQRHLADLRRGRRLRAPRVVDRRGLGLEGGVRHHAPGGLGRGPGRRAAQRRIDGSRRSHPDEPVVHVSWFEADAFARAHGARLPTRPSGRRRRPGTRTGRRGPYPWGDEPPCPRAREPRPRGLRPAPGRRPPRRRLALRRARRCSATCGSGPPRLPRLRRLPAPTRTASTPRSSSAPTIACCAAARGPPACRVDLADVPQLGPPAAPPDLLRAAAGLGRVD